MWIIECYVQDDIDTEAVENGASTTRTIYFLLLIPNNSLELAVLELESRCHPKTLRCATSLNDFDTLDPRHSSASGDRNAVNRSP